MKLRLASLIAVAALGLVLYLKYTRPTLREDTAVLPGSTRGPVAPSSTPATAKGADTTALREEVASLRAELASLRQQRPGHTGSASATEDRTDTDAGARARAREEAAQRRQAHIAALDSAFHSESVNPTWSANTSSLIQNVLSSDEIGHIQADSIDCRSESCRVELHDDGTGRLGKSLPMLAIQVASALPTITANNVARPDGSSTVVLYLSRQSGDAAR
jgi:hypothetical protein